MDDLSSVNDEPVNVQNITKDFDNRSLRLSQCSSRMRPKREKIGSPRSGGERGGAFSGKNVSLLIIFQRGALGCDKGCVRAGSV